MNAIQKFIEFFFRKKWLGLLIILAIFVGIGISTIYRGGFSPKQRTDLAVFMKGAEMIQEDNAQSLYGAETVRYWHYVYSPLLAILLAPATQLPFSTVVTSFYLISFLCLLAIFLLSKNFIEKTAGVGWKIALAATLCFPVFLNTLTRGQLGILMLFFQAVIFVCYLKGWRTLAGLFLGFAISLKISPLAILIFFFLFKKEWRLLFATALSGFIFLIFFPSLVIGYQSNWELLQVWRGLMSQGSSILAYKSYLWKELLTPYASDNQSLYAVITRFVWPTKDIFIAQANNWVRWGIMAGGCLTLLLLFLKRQLILSFPIPQTDRIRILAEYSIFPMLMLFFSPVTQIHHYTSLYFLFFAALLMREEPSAHKKLLTAGIWAAAGLFFLGLVIEPLSYIGLPLWGAIFLSGILVLHLKPRKN